MPADIHIRGKYQGQEVTTGLKKIEDQTKTIGQGFAQLKTITLGVLGAGGIEGAVRSVGNVLRGLAEEQRQSARLFKAMELAGVDVARQMSRVNDVTVRLRDNSFFSDVQIQSGLTQLVTMTGDYEGALRNLSLALDLAEARQMSVEESSRKVASAMLGIAEPLGEILPQIRGMNEAFKELSQAERATKILEMIQGSVGGAHGAGMDTAAGAWKQIAEGVKELSQAIISIPLDKLNALAAIARPGGEQASVFSLLAGSVEGGALRGMVEKQFIPRELQALPAMIRFMDHFIGPDALKNFNTMGGFAPSFPGSFVGPMPPEPQQFFGPPISEKQRASILTDRMMAGAYLRNFDEMYGGRRGGIRNDFRSKPEDILAPFVRGIGVDKIPGGEGGFARAHAKTLIDEFKKEQQAIGAPIQSAIKSALEGGVRDGLPGAMASLGSTLFDTVLNAVSMALTNAIVPAGGEAGGLLGSIVGLLGGGKSGGVKQAANTNVNWRLMRDYE